MRVSKERLSVIGRLIGIYREERRDNTQNEYTQKRFCDGICSPNTLKSIEAGGLSRSEDIYIELLDKLGLKYGEFPAIDEAIDELMVKLYEAIEYFDRKQIETILSKMRRLLIKVNEYVFYCELFNLFKQVHDYYLNDLIISDDLKLRYLEMIKFLGTQYSDIFRILIFSKVQSLSSSNKKEYTEVIEKLNLSSSGRGFIKLMQMHYCFVIDDYFKMKDLKDYLESYYSENKNITRQLDVYNYAINLHSYVEREMLPLYIDKIEKLICDYDFPDLKISEMYSNIGSALYFNKNYKLALEYYQKMLVKYNDNYIIKYVYMADCQNRLGLPIEIPKIDNRVYNQFPLNIKMMYKYFTLDKDTPLFIKQNFIMKKILPDLENEVSIDIFRFELSRLVEETGHYKNVFLFDKTISENITRS